MKKENKMESEHFASVYARNLRISPKHSIEIMDYIRNKPLKKVKILLNQVIEKRKAIPFKRYNKDVGHKPGVGAGRYPIKACKEVLRLINALEANAENKGLDVNKLVLNYCVANRGNIVLRHGRKIRRKFKQTHIEMRAIEK